MDVMTHRCVEDDVVSSARGARPAARRGPGRARRAARLRPDRGRCRWADHRIRARRAPGVGRWPV